MAGGFPFTIHHFLACLLPSACCLLPSTVASFPCTPMATPLLSSKSVASFFESSQLSAISHQLKPLLSSSYCLPRTANGRLQLPTPDLRSSASWPRYSLTRIPRLDNLLENNFRTPRFFCHDLSRLGSKMAHCATTCILERLRKGLGFKQPLCLQRGFCLIRNKG